LQFEMDMEGKRADWEAIVLIPFINETRLLAAEAEWVKENMWVLVVGCHAGTHLCTQMSPKFSCDLFLTDFHCYLRVSQVETRTPPAGKHRCRAHQVTRNSLLLCAGAVVGGLVGSAWCTCP
jgi:hypothetical protein